MTDLTGRFHTAPGCTSLYTITRTNQVKCYINEAAAELKERGHEEHILCWRCSGSLTRFEVFGKDVEQKNGGSPSYGADHRPTALWRLLPEGSRLTCGWHLQHGERVPVYMRNILTFNLQPQSIELKISVWISHVPSHACIWQTRTPAGDFQLCEHLQPVESCRAEPSLCVTQLSAPESEHTTSWNQQSEIEV